MISQLRRASVSTSSNIAEETSRQTIKDKAHFTAIAFSLSTEILNQIIISKELSFISENQYILVRKKITNMLNSLRKSQLNQ